MKIEVTGITFQMTAEEVEDMARVTAAARSAMLSRLGQMRQAEARKKEAALHNTKPEKSAYKHDPATPTLRVCEEQIAYLYWWEKCLSAQKFMPMARDMKAATPVAFDVAMAALSDGDEEVTTQAERETCAEEQIRAAQKDDSYYRCVVCHKAGQQKKHNAWYCNKCAALDDTLSVHVQRAGMGLPMRAPYPLMLQAGDRVQLDADNLNVWFEFTGWQQTAVRDEQELWLLSRAGLLLPSQVSDHRVRKRADSPDSKARWFAIGQQDAQNFTRVGPSVNVPAVRDFFTVVLSYISTISVSDGEDKPTALEHINCACKCLRGAHLNAVDYDDLIRAAAHVIRAALAVRGDDARLTDHEEAAAAADSALRHGQDERK